MLAKNKTTKFIISLLIVAIIAPSILFSKPQKASAMIPTADFLTHLFTGTTAGATGTSAAANTTQTAISIKNLAKEIGRQILMTVARKLLQEMTKSTINWINSGFHGSPLFVENSGSFFKDIAKFEIKTLVDQFGYDSNRFPFGRQFALNIIDSYKRTLDDNASYTLSKVINDPLLLNRYRNDFNVGGWNGFLVNTQYPQNNYLGFQILATDEAGRRLEGTTQNAAQKIQTTLQQGFGFLSPQTCLSNPSYNNAVNQFQQPSFKSKIPYNPPKPYGTETGTDVDYVFVESPASIQARYDYETEFNSQLAEEKQTWNKTNFCPGGLVNTTPGSVVASQITNAMGSQFRQSELAAAMGNSISAVLDALLNKFISSGLNSLASKANPPPLIDDWSYNGQTLGGPTNNTKDIFSGPDEVIVLDDFKKAVQDGIDNTNLELKLMYNEVPDSSFSLGIAQYLGLIWPKTRDLDICLPGPDIGWQDRTLKEMDRNSQKLDEKINDNDPQKAATAQLVSNELKFAVDSFKDWINNKMITELPGSILYMDAVSEIETIYQQSDELTDKRRVKNQAVARLQAIKTALSASTFAGQPATGSAEERALVSLKKQYNATFDVISNSASIEDTRNELAVAKDKLSKLNKLVAQCSTERQAKGWSMPGSVSGGISTFSGRDNYGISGTEKNIYCDAPLKGGYDHESFRHENDNPPKPITHPDLPYVNANDVLKWRGKLGLFSHSANIEMSCNIIYKANVLDYKRTIPGLTGAVEPYVEPVDDTGTVGNTGGVTTPANTTTPNPNTAVNGRCGAANGQIFSSAPTTNLCSDGSPSAVTGTGPSNSSPWHWTCSGSGGGSDANCSTQ